MGSNAAIIIVSARGIQRHCSHANATSCTRIHPQRKRFRIAPDFTEGADFTIDIMVSAFIKKGYGLSSGNCEGLRVEVKTSDKNRVVRARTVLSLDKAKGKDCNAKQKIFSIRPKTGGLPPIYEAPTK
jgi:hypothetical protein